MKKELEIIRANGKNYLCFKDQDVDTNIVSYVNIANMMIAFETGVDEFEIIPTDETLKEKIYTYQGCEVCLAPALYSNGWMALTVANPNDKRDFRVLTINLEDIPALGVPDRVFVDCNNEPEALEFLVKNNLAVDMGYSRQSGFASYPMMMVDLALIYQHAPEVFININI